MATPVSEHFSQPFTVRSLEDQRRIVHEGPKRPVFISSQSKDPGEKLVQFITTLVYREAQWITGCPERRTFFCWSCLLFGENEWAYAVTDYKYGKERSLINYIREHEKSVKHIKAEFDLQMFRMQHLKSPNVNLKTRNDTEKKQRDVLGRLIGVVYKHIIQEANRRKSCGKINVEDCVRVLQLTRNYDNYCVSHINSAIELMKQSPKIVCDIVDALTSVVKLAIKSEIQLSTYVSLILSEHSEVANRSHISTVVRYIINGCVCERFIGFSHLNNTTDEVVKHIGNILVEFQIYERFLAYSLDGGVLPLSDFIKLFFEMKKEYPFAFLVPWHAHRLEYVLEQSFSMIKEYRNFFKFIKALKNCLSENSKQWKFFQNFMEAKIGILVNFEWFESQTITVVYTNRVHFVEFFDSIVKSSKRWDAADVVKALSFKNFFQNPITVILLHLFAELLDLTDSFRRCLQGDIPRKMFNEAVVDDLKDKLEIKRLTGFEKSWDTVYLSYFKKTDRLSICMKSNFRKLYLDILSRTSQEIAARFEEVVELEFCRILKLDLSKKENLYIDLYLGNLETAQGPCFEKKELIEKEMKVLNEKMSEFPMASLEEVHHFLLGTEVRDAMPSVFKSVEFSLTLPTQRTTCSKISSKLQDISKWVFASEHLVTSGDISILCVELDYLLDLSKSESFYNEVMNVFLMNLKQQLNNGENNEQVQFFSEIIP